MTKKRLQSFAQASIWIGAALFLWIWIWPVPYPLAIAVALILPWGVLGLIAKFPNAQSLDLKRSAERGSLGSIFFMLALVLAMRALVDLSFLDVWRLIVAAVVAAAIVMIILMRVLPKLPEKWGDWAALGIAVLAYGYGAVAQLDTIPDHAPTQTYRATVSNMYVSHGKSWSYNLDLAPWGPDESASSTRVSAQLYARVKPGMQMCATLHPGLVGLRWYTVAIC